MEYRVGIIGCGPAGMFLGMNLKCRAAMFERMPQCGKKLLASGAGKCNFTHSGSIKDFVLKYGEHGNFVKNGLKRFSNEDLLKYLDDKGYNYEIREDGKYFPKSYSSMEFRNFLVRNNILSGNDIKVDSEVLDINMSEGKFQLVTVDKIYQFDYLIIATGGKSYPKTGSDGKIFSVLKKLGHNIINMKPALTPAYIKEFQFSDLMGLSFEDIVVENWRNGKKIFSSKGQLLITHFGFSGPVILDKVYEV